MQKNRFFEELKKFPNLEICRIATKEQIQRIMKEADFSWLNEEQNLNLTKAEVTDDLLCEVMLFIISRTDWSDEDFPIYYVDEKFWNMEDEATKELLGEIKRVFHHTDELALLKLEDFLNRIKEEE